MLKIVEYQIIRQAWQNPGSGCDTVLVKLSDNTVTTEYLHPSSWWWSSERFKDVKVRSFADSPLTSE